MTVLEFNRENKQKFFDIAYKGLRDQGFEKALVKNSGVFDCVYRSPKDNRKCAFGHVIPDSAYHPSQEGLTARALIEGTDDRLLGSFDKEFFKQFRSDDWKEFFGDLQVAHDGAKDASDVESRLTDFASRHGLSIPMIGVSGVGHNLLP